MAFIFWILPRAKKDNPKLFSPSFMNKFGCLYYSYYFRRCWYLEVISLRKLLTGAIIGFLQGHPSTQLALLLVVQVLYLVQLFILRPYLDVVHMFLDVTTTLFNGTVVALMYAFVSASDEGITKSVVSGCITLCLLLSMTICLGTFISSWLKMKNIHTVRQLVARCFGRDRNDPSDHPAFRNEEFELSVEDSKQD